MLGNLRGYAKCRNAPRPSLAHATGNQAFKFIDQGQFTGEGQLRFFQQNGDTIIEANTDNSVPGADMVIVCDTLMTPKGLDFFL